MTERSVPSLRIPHQNCPLYVGSFYFSVQHYDFLFEKSQNLICSHPMNKGIISSWQLHHKPLTADVTNNYWKQPLHYNCERHPI
jgi:hypothetical protein